MKQRTLVSLLGMLSLLMLSCAGSKHGVWMPDYKGKVYRNAVLLIAPVDQIAFYQSEDVAEDIKTGFDVEELVPLLSDHLVAVQKDFTNFEDVTYVIYKEEPVAETRTLEISKKEKMRMDLPTLEDQIEYEWDGPVFVLFLQDVRIGVVRETGETGAAPKYHYTVSGVRSEDAKVHRMKPFKYYLNGEAKYAVLDNRNGKLVSYGRVKHKRKYEFSKTLNHNYLSEGEALIQTIWVNTPFQRGD